MLMPDDDFVLPFEIDRTGLRGRLVRLGPAVDFVLKRHAYPANDLPSVGRGVGAGLLPCIDTEIRRGRLHVPGAR